MITQQDVLDRLRAGHILTAQCLCGEVIRAHLCSPVGFDKGDKVNTNVVRALMRRGDIGWADGHYPRRGTSNRLVLTP